MSEVTWTTISNKKPGLGILCVSLEPDMPTSLTPAEREVVRLLIKGSSYRGIAEERDCAVSTVANHVASILKKSDTRSTSEMLARLAAGTLDDGDGRVG